MIRQIVACAALFVVAASGPVLAQQQQGNAQLAAVISSFEQLQRRVDPLTAGGEGDRAALRRLPDASPEAAAALKRDLVALRTQLSQVPDHGLNDGDTIWTESSYKYRAEQVDDMLEAANLHLCGQWIDSDSQFALTLAKA